MRATDHRYHKTVTAAQAARNAFLKTSSRALMRFGKLRLWIKPRNLWIKDYVNHAAPPRILSDAPVENLFAPVPLSREYSTARRLLYFAAVPSSTCPLLCPLEVHCHEAGRTPGS